MGRTPRAHRRNAAIVGGPSVEFGELLDPIDAIVSTITVVSSDRRAALDVGPDASLDGGPVAVDVAVAEPMPVSRFADTGVDDDRLPLRASTKRRRRGY